MYNHLWLIMSNYLRSSLYACMIELFLIIYKKCLILRHSEIHLLFLVKIVQLINC